jgi:sulfatase maturation enzyme AslB (radical SAM superfamily)
MNHANAPDFDAIGLPADKSAFIHLCWLLHNQCNHRCSYCSEINWGGTFRDLDLNQAKKFVEKAIQHFAGRRLMVSFTGGGTDALARIWSVCRLVKVEKRHHRNDNKRNSSSNFLSRAREEFQLDQF